MRFQRPAMLHDHNMAHQLNKKSTNDGSYVCALSKTRFLKLYNQLVKIKDNDQSHLEINQSILQLQMFHQRADLR